MARSAGKALRNHATLELDCFDRLHLNAQVPLLQTGTGTACFLREVRGNPAPSSALMAHMTRRFTGSLERFARERLQKRGSTWKEDRPRVPDSSELSTNRRRTSPGNRNHYASNQSGKQHLRRLRLIERLPNLHRYRLTEDGHRIALACCRIHRRALTPTVVAVFNENMPPKLGRVIRSTSEEIARLWTSQHRVGPVEDWDQMVGLCH